MKQLMSKVNKFVWVAVVLSIISVGTAHAQGSLNTKNVNISIVKSFDNERITVAGTAIGFTASKINPTVTDKPAGFSQALVATCVNGSNAIVILSSGGTPTSTNGLPIAANQSFTVYGYDDISNFLAIRTGSSSTLDCQYSRLP